MAKAQPICIITPGGMKCLSSPIKRHFPGRQACRIVAPIPAVQSAALRAVQRNLAHARLSAGAQVVIAKVVELMMASGVDGRMPFTIVKA
jgi:hypothetical protein